MLQNQHLSPKKMFLLFIDTLCITLSQITHKIKSQKKRKDS
jgi:hypothetical protein